ncbi:MAG: SPASM domain-containing protein [Candidatus Aminicenantes bacterium]|nr:SPASM domain-containing protein [Candidatus Aminicenantes bacterium]NIM83182.1 SPASM domain-containing protein [Candidatus Aminicenantes bacterium]NIN22559.1 SPASM domain-containing protein [Candidatus Aminicenantes bacterium]NIN46328.1 SPASM domain-containing protein [Candidatus Aminicenantes bacterium]NIN89169.1 SPASM domain-containing protein [Candidatus Aminicenantes bacterium]
MKISKYNFFYKLGNEDFLAFNALKNGLAVVDKEVVNTINSLEDGSNLEDVDNELLKELEKGGFICADDFDEYGLLTIRRHRQQYDTHFLSLTIAPTLNCNLACNYCFEDPDETVMSDDVINGVVKFVNHHIKTTVKNLEVCWYGGEPLLCLDVIEKLSSEFMSLCKKNNVRYSSYIITNGTHFTPEVAKKMKEWKVKGAQITIDGDRETHNLRRPFRGGKGSFDKIFENVKQTVGIIPISIRINVDAHNVDRVIGFFKELENEEWFHKNFGEMVTLHFGHVRKYTNSCRCKDEESLKQGNFWKKELELQRHIFKSGYKFNIYPDISSGCVATSINSYVIDAKGNLYKCFNDLGVPHNSVGTIFKPVTFTSLYITKMVESFEKDTGCQKCKYLPICMGGCVDIRVRAKKGEFSAKDCTGWKYYLEETLRMFHLYKMEQKASQKQKF